ncbi:MAG: 2-amino-4-hydroxy-6-hydroxymethyldihydropteridine diphosphokinase [Omnitrophica bacterium]|nr:2-amino-4-hydroxy-6-hydroxymethyldihydropteridine diphosphokinase [Candidatus Omnitrophota bacterium]
MPAVFIGIGSNLGDRADNIRRAICCLKSKEGISVEKISSIIETKAHKAVGPDYLNGVIKIITMLSAEDILLLLQECERQIGRKSSFKNAPRVIDLDILLYGGDIIDEPNLKVPHPRMFERDFVLRPLFEIEPGIKTVLDALKDKYRSCHNQDAYH